ncbi:hypothetical protein [Usitatibacter palustris]|uniref:Uncharacterized protein n=1 Tax=Usitatibacter palustris TaxID=2732487 RepID=A0A6M4H3F9_9PROT|nr:hypothetical protein [Usitatibacter palustris]QJR13885.1 hypothetical protein DSM104440_00675 [Usitatibacter palustris]
MKRLAAVLFACAAAAPFAQAGTRLDDSGSPRSRVEVQSRWLHHDEGLSPERLNAMVADITNLEFRLDTSRYVGKRARIYFVIPDFISGLRSVSGMRVEWRSRGTFLPGSALPGQRALVYDGLIQRPSIHESLDLQIYLDARHIDRITRFDPSFEIDVAP